MSTDKNERLAVLLDFFTLNGPQKTLILTERQEDVSIVQAFLTHQDPPILAAYTHGDLLSESRERPLHQFSLGSPPVLVATRGICGRGLNLKGLECVIVFTVPIELTEYKFCIGRVGRLGNPGRSLTIFHWTDEGAANMYPFEYVSLC